MIHRAQLHELITDQFGPAITVRTGCTVTKITQDDAGVTINDDLRADLVIAADGIRSVIRQTLVPGVQGTAVLRLHGVPGYRRRRDRRRWR